MNNLEIDTGYSPREWQKQTHLKLRRFNVLNCHRQSGKTIFCVNHKLDRALRCKTKNPYYAYIAQTYSSAKRVVWDTFKKYTEKFNGIRANESELIIRIPRPWAGDVIKIQLLGSENYDAIRGLSLDGMTFDEFGFSMPDAWFNVAIPALSSTRGWANIVSTPNGRNHFFDLYNAAEKKYRENDPDWFAMTMTVDDSGLLSQKEKDQYREMMGDERYQQEMMCSFFAQVRGSYYKQQLEKLKDKGQIRNFPIDISQEVHTAWDLGIGDSTAIWFFQIVGTEVHVVDHHEDSGKSLEEYVKVIKNKDFIIGETILPHDANARSLETGKTRLEALRSLGLTRLRILPRQSIEDGINAVRMTLPMCYFHESNCQRGLECLYNYRKEYNEKMQTYVDRPVHDWASDSADAFRYLALGLTHLQSKARRSDASLPRVSNSVYDIYGV